MNRYRFRASEGTYKPRSGVGLGKGSHQPFQRLLEPLFDSVRNSDERLGFVQGWGVCGVYPAGGSPEVSSPSQGSSLNAPVNAHGIACWCASARRHPFPPAPTVPLWGVPRNFSPTFPVKGLSHE
jgi:hypothetical protein